MAQTGIQAELQFLRGFIARPFAVASPVPSGRALADKIAKQIDPVPGGLVLELGPGTGAVTQALRQRGVADPDLVAIESDPRFVALLRTKFPRIRIIEGDAFEFAELLRDAARPLNGIVCGLPVLGQLNVRRRHLLRSAMAALKPGAPFVQFSYGAWPPLPPLEGVGVRRAATVWRNIPPMHVWVFRRPAIE